MKILKWDSSSISGRSICLACLLSVICFSPMALRALPSGTWQYYWGDDFSGTSVDSGKWNVASPDWGMSTAAPTASSASKVHVGSGLLTLEATRTKINGSNASGDENFTGGMISTYGKQNFNGGYIEARIWLPDTPGSWPAFWGLYDGWPPEMDIMEYPLGAYAADQYHTAFHYDNGGSPAAGAGQVNPGGIGDLRGGYHIFGVNWIEDDYVGFYFDGALVSSFGNDADVAEMASMYLILNYAVGGWPATPDTTTWPVGFTDRTRIDWVRVWKSGSSKISDWIYGGSGSSVSWDTAGNWNNGVPNLGGVISSFGTVTPAEQRIAWSGKRMLSVINLDGSTRYRFGSPNNRLVLGYGDNGSINPAINIAASSSAEHEIYGDLEWSGDLNINNDSSQAFLLTGKIMGGSGININGSGAVNFDGDGNSYSGTTYIDSGSQGPGIARARGRYALGVDGMVVIGEQGNGTTGRLELENNSLIANPISLNGRTNPSVGILNNSGTNTISGTVGAQVGGSYFLIQSDAGQLNLSGSSQTANGVALNNLTTSARTVTLQGAGDGKVSGIIEDHAGTLNLVKDGNGTWTFDVQNTYSGTTTVSAGELMVNGSTGSGNTTVANGATLSGGGTVNANLTAQPGSMIRIGDEGFTLVPDTTYALTDNFQSYASGANGTTLVPAWLAGFPGGSAGGSSATLVGADAGSGQALHYVYGGSGGQINYASIGTIAPEGSTGTIFFQAYLSNTGSDTLFGFGRPGAAGYSDLASLFRVVSSRNIEVHNGGYTATGTSISTSTLYNFWLVINNSANTSTLYYSPGGAGQSPVLIQSGYAFRNAAAGAINTFYLGSNSGSAGFIDNIYIDSTGANLTNPLDTPPMVTESATLNVANNFTLSSGSTLEFDLSSPALYDRLVVGGQFNASGTLKVTLEPDQPAPWTGDTFDLFDAAGGTVSFAAFDLPDLAEGLAWDTSLINSGVLSVTGTPSGFAGYMSDYGIPGASFEGDANSNGVPNGMEYYLGWNPTNPLPPPSILRWTNNYLSTVYPYNALASGVSGMVEWTTDLMSSNWLSSGVTYATNSAPDEIEATLGSSITNQLFIRLKVNQ